MKNIVIASAFTLAATASLAGGLDQPIVEPMVMAPEVIETAAQEQFGDEWVLALMAFLTVVVMGMGG